MELTKSQEQMRRVNEAISEAFNSQPRLKELLASVMPRQASYRYVERDGSRDRYFYTTQKINHKGKPRYVAGIYRFLKTRKAFKLVKRVGFAKKKLAIAWVERAKSSSL